MKDRIKDLDEIVDIQTSDGNWNYDEYMYGKANGLILAQSIIKDSDCNYLDKPKKWLKKPGDNGINIIGCSEPYPEE